MTGLEPQLPLGFDGAREALSRVSNADAHFWGLLKRAMMSMPKQEAWSQFLILVDAAAASQLPTLAVSVGEPLIQRDWRSIAPTLSAAVAQHPALACVLADAVLSNLPEDVETLITSLARSPDDGDD